MAAGDVTAALRAYSDEQIEQDKRTCIELLRLHDEDTGFALSESVAAWDIANRYQTWEFRSGFLTEAPSLYPSRIAWSLDAIENGVDDWYTTVTPEWAYCTWTDYEADVPGQRIKHEGPSIKVAGGSLLLTRTDVVDMDAETVTEGPLEVEVEALAMRSAALPFADFVAAVSSAYSSSVAKSSKRSSGINQLFTKEVAS